MRAIVRLAAFASTCTAVLFSAIILLNNANVLVANAAMWWWRALTS